MKISFFLQERSLELELSEEMYKKLKQIIDESSSLKEALSFCDTLNSSHNHCRELVAYEFSQKKHREKLPLEFDTLCDYDDHL